MRMWELLPEPPDSDAALPPTTAYDSTAFTCRFLLLPALLIIRFLLMTALDFGRPTYGAKADVELPPVVNYDRCLSTLRELPSACAHLMIIINFAYLMKMIKFAYPMMIMLTLPTDPLLRSLRSTFETLEMLLMMPTQMLTFAGTPSFKICPPRRSAQNAWWTTTFAWCDSAFSALPLLMPTSTTALLWPSLAGNYNYSMILQCLLPVDTFHGEDKSMWLKHGGLHCYYLDKRHGGIPHGGCSHCGLDSWRVWGVLSR